MTFRPGIRFVSAFVLAAASYSTACLAIPNSLPFAEVVSMSKRGDAPSSIAGAMRSARTTYALRGSDFGKLAAIGVSPVVLDEIQQSFSDDVDLLTRYWVQGESLGRCAPCYPQQVSLAGVDSGVPPTTTPPPLRAPFLEATRAARLVQGAVLQVEQHLHRTGAPDVQSGQER